jgi:predicted PurR-regulated permease PerM
MPFSLKPEQKQTLLWLAVGATLIVVLALLGPVLTPFIIAAILAYALNPGVDWLASCHIGKLKMPRAVAVVLMMLFLAVVLLVLVLIVVPMMQKQIPLLQERIPNFLVHVQQILVPRLAEMGIDVQLDSASLRQMVTEYLSDSGDQIWSAILASARVGGTAVLAWLATLFLVPVVLFYLLLDWHGLLARAANVIPRRWLGKTAAIASEADDLLAQYLRGQLLVMLILAVYYSSALAFADFDVALPVGILTGVLVFIPYVGFGLGLTLALIAGFLQFDGLYGLVAVAVIYGIGQVLESTFLTPYLVGERIGLHPLAVIFALLAFGQLFGFAGVLLALPAFAVLAVALRHLNDSYRDSSFYKES